MSAPSQRDLLDYESQWDACLTTVLAPFAAVPFSFTLVPQDETGALPAQRLEYGFTLGEPAGPGRTSLQRDVLTVPQGVAKNFSLVFRFVYDRTKFTANAKQIRGELRRLMLPTTASFNASTLPFLKVVGLEEKRSVRGVVKGEEAAKLLSIWESTWDGIFVVRSDAHPV